MHIFIFTHICLVIQRYVATEETSCAKKYFFYKEHDFSVRGIFTKANAKYHVESLIIHNVPTIKSNL